MNKTKQVRLSKELNNGEKHPEKISQTSGFMAPKAKTKIIGVLNFSNGGRFQFRQQLVNNIL
jgi:hypothetical protein